MKVNKIYNEECLQGMEERIPDNSIDMILADLPYGTTACKWDSIIPLEPLWGQYKRIVKDDTAIVLTASQPFTTELIDSNRDWFKYELIWEKDNGTNFLNAKHQPLKVHENIVVFSNGASSYSTNTNMKYNPQMTKGEPYKITSSDGNHEYHENPSGYTTDNEGERYPRSVIRYNSEKGLHPTQKPVALFKYLIKTYTDKGDIVLDNVIGSGTTAVAAKALDRKYIGFEQDEEYYEIAKERVGEVQKELI